MVDAIQVNQPMQINRAIKRPAMATPPISIRQIRLTFNRSRLKS